MFAQTSYPTDNLSETGVRNPHKAHDNIITHIKKFENSIMYHNLIGCWTIEISSCWEDLKSIRFYALKISAQTHGTHPDDWYICHKTYNNNNQEYSA